MRQKHRNLETEKYVARKQAYALGGGLEVDDLMRMIDAKGGDYYRAELNPNPEAREAYDHFGMTGRRETLDLQDKIATEMRSYYGLGDTAQRAADPVVRPTVSMDAPMRDPVIDAPLPQPPTNPEAQAYKDDAVQEVLLTQGDAVGDSMREFERQNNKEFRDSALLVALGLGSGVGVGQLLQPEEEEVNALRPNQDHCLQQR